MTNAEMQAFEREALTTEAWDDPEERSLWATFIGIPDSYERRVVKVGRQVIRLTVQIGFDAGRPYWRWTSSSGHLHLGASAESRQAARDAADASIPRHTEECQRFRELVGGVPYVR